VWWQYLALAWGTGEEAVVPDEDKGWKLGGQDYIVADTAN